jgi:hypothetical protein
MEFLFTQSDRDESYCANQTAPEGRVNPKPLKPILILTYLLAPFEILDGTLTGLGRLTSAECTKVSPSTSFRIFFPRVQTITSGGQFPNQANLPIEFALIRQP